MKDSLVAQVTQMTSFYSVGWKRWRHVRAGVSIFYDPRDRSGI